ncbi:MAG: PEP-CTERM sorting domain-containing protein [Terracidiphilus sp.]
MSLSSPRLKQLILLAAVTALAATAHAAGISATATIAYTEPSPGVYDYSLTLNNTGTTTIGTFWFGWVPGEGFLTTAPTSVVAPTGWTDTVTNSGAAVRWVTTTNLLAAGDSLSGFSFDSTETPDQLALTVPSGVGAGDPVTTSYVYIGAPLQDPGYQLDAQLTPEPSTMLLFLTGSGLVGFVKRKLRA